MYRFLSQFLQFIKPIVTILPHAIGVRLLVLIMKFTIWYEKTWLEHYVKMADYRNYFEVVRKIRMNRLCPENLVNVFEEHMNIIDR
jgi:hypothetical protein